MHGNVSVKVVRKRVGKYKDVKSKLIICQTIVAYVPINGTLLQ
jgi:hypothetical protein